MSNMTTVTKEPVAQFIRLWVLKSGLEHKKRYPRTDFTNIYVRSMTLPACPSWRTVAGRRCTQPRASRLASSRCKKKPGVSWSATVIAGATRISKAEQATRADAQLKDYTPELNETLAHITAPWVHRLAM